MATETLQRPQLEMRALFTPETINVEQRTVELVWSTGAQVQRSSWSRGDYIEELSMAPGAVRMDRLNKGAPLLDAHDSFSLRSQIGVVQRAWLNGNEGRALVKFSARKDVEPIFQDVVAGIYRNVSVGYKVHKTERDESGPIPIERATDWEPYELSLVPIPADAGAQVRSATNNNIGGNMTTESINNTENLDIRADERRRISGITDAGAKLKAPDSLIRQLIDDGTDLHEARMQLLDHQAQEQMRTPCISRTFEPGGEAGQAPLLQRQLDAAIQRGEDVRLDDVLRSMGVRGRSPIERVKNAMQQRGMISTSDLALSLTMSMDGRLQAKFPAYSGGILNAADVRPISDFRPYGLVDTGLVGAAKKLKEGAEVPYVSVEEAAATAKAARFALALAHSVEAQANDGFLGGLRQCVDELGTAASDAEKTELVYQLEGTANGGTCADGQALFHTSHKNSVANGPISIATLGEAVALLRGQKSVGGRHIDQLPAMIVCGTGAELTIRQLLSTAVVPSSQSAVNPWASFVDVEVEPRLGDNFCYLISAGPRKPLELGRLYPAPQISSMVDFETGAFKTKAEHAFGTAVSEFRAIVRVKLAA